MNYCQLSEAEKKEKAEVETRLKLLKELQDGCVDPGPLIHCIVWHDGSAWRAAIDTSEVEYGRAGEALLHPLPSSHIPGLGNLPAQ